MKKTVALAVIFSLIIALGLPAFSATKKKTTVKKTTIKRTYRRSQRWPAGKRPVFPVDKGGNEIKPKSAAPAVTKTTKAQPVKPLTPAKTSARTEFFGEAGLGGGALVLEMGLKKPLKEKLEYSAGIGYGIGSRYGVVVLDFARIDYDLGGFKLGGGLSYAMYSAIVSEIPGLSGKLASKSLLGVELSLSKMFGKMTGRAAYNTALGIRASAGCAF